MLFESTELILEGITTSLLLSQTVTTVKSEFRLCGTDHVAELV